MDRFGRTRKLLTLGLIALMMLCIAPIAQAAKKPKTAYLKSNTRMLTSVKSSAKTIFKLEKGSSISVLGTKGSWARVKLDGKTGYVKKSRLTSKQPATATVDKYQVIRPGDKGDAVKKLQTRLKALGWFNGSIGGNYLTLTKQAVIDFQEAAELPTSGIADVQMQAALYGASAPRFSISGVSTANPAKGEIRRADWWKSGIQEYWARRKYAVVTDVRTGISFKVIRVGGYNHADTQPVTAKDTAAMKKAYGGKWSWDRRAIWVSVGGKRYAASMNGMPHGSDSISGNNFNGMFCIHFTNSKGHGSNAVCPLHQAAIEVAMAAS